jgi:hypothetical protein
MKIISPKIHVVLDYVVAIFLIIAPNLIDLSANAAIFSMVLGSIHFLLTIVTIFKGGVVKLVPFPIHGIIELIVSVTLGILAFTLFSNHMADHFYYAGLAVAIFLVYLLTDYKAAAK